jgi:alkyl sulfatase BDS1-like metallo-beta-lactamase superfamily hydrolase
VAKFASADHPLVEAVAWRPESPGEWANGFIAFSRGTSNSNLVLTEAGEVAINTGAAYQGPRHRARFEALLGRPLAVRKVILTQYHADHVGGWSAFAGQGVEILAQREFPRLREEWKRLSPFYMPRGATFLSGMMPDPAHVQSYFGETPEPGPVTLVDRGLGFDLGGRRFELLSVPSGETLDSLAVWMPNERALFIGNFAGALYGALPNFYTIRGDRARSVPGFLADLQRLMDLEPEILVTGHGAPVSGREAIRSDLARVRDAVRHIHDETVAGMNAGRDLHALMREIRLPVGLRPAAGRAPVGWCVRAVWEEYSGWFLQQSTTELYGTPASAVWGELVALAGGVAVLAERAAGHLAAGRPLEALHLTDMALSVAPDHRPTRAAQIAALERLVEQGGGTAYDELGWLEHQIALARAAAA